MTLKRCSPFRVILYGQAKGDRSPIPAAGEQSRGLSGQGTVRFAVRTEPRKRSSAYDLVTSSIRKERKMYT